MTKAVTRHNLTSGFVVAVVGVPLAFVWSIPNLFTLAEAEKMQTASMAPARQVRDGIRADINTAAQGSRIPYDLVNANKCTPVVLSSNGELAEFLPGVAVEPRTPNGQPVPPGSYVCSRGGQSAQVGINKELVNVQSTPLEKLEEYQEVYDLMLKLQNRI